MEGKKGKRGRQRNLQKVNKADFGKGRKCEREGRPSGGGGIRLQRTILREGKTQRHAPCSGYHQKLLFKGRAARLPPHLPSRF